MNNRHLKRTTGKMRLDINDKPHYYNEEFTPVSSFSEINANRAQSRTVNIDPLKAFVAQNFQKNCPLRATLLAERSVLTVPEFLAKMETWQTLLGII
jgi:hypothetical protein